MLEYKTYKVKIRLLSELLGSQPSRDIWRTHIATDATKKMKREGMTDEQIKAKLDEDFEGLPENNPMEEKKVFYRTPDGKPCLQHYQIHGWLKNTCRILNKSGKLKQMRKKCVDYLHIKPFHIPLAVETLGETIRPLRADLGILGERTCIAVSESVPAGVEIEFSIVDVNNTFGEQLLRNILEHGEISGMGQWRSARGFFELVEFSEA